MKIIAYKVYYQETVYQISQKTFVKKPSADELQSKLEPLYKKGDFEKWEAIVWGKYCCKDMEHELNSGHAKLIDNYWDEKEIPGVYLAFQGWEEADWEKINFCPWCGEKIEVIYYKKVGETKDGRDIYKNPTTRKLMVRDEDSDNLFNAKKTDLEGAKIWD